MRPRHFCFTPQQRTFEVQLEMSAKCQRRTWEGTVHLNGPGEQRRVASVKVSQIVRHCSLKFGCSVWVMVWVRGAGGIE